MDQWINSILKNGLRVQGLSKHVGTTFVFLYLFLQLSYRRTLLGLGAKGIATRNKDATLLGAPRLTTRSKDATI